MRKLIFVTALLLSAGIAIGQTLKKGEVLGIHIANVVLKPDVTTNQYLEFLQNSIIPELNKIDGLTTYLMKGDRGENQYNYAMVYICESVDVRNKLFPEEGEYNEEMAALTQKLMQAQSKFLLNMVDEYTDWIVQ